MVAPADRLDVNRTVIEEFRANDGRVANPLIPVNLRLALLTTTGARTGKPRTSPLAYFGYGSDCIVVLASAYGDASHPAWYRNILANGRVTIELVAGSGALERVAATARTANGAERDQLIAAMESEVPIMIGFTKNEHREVPVVVLDY